MTTFDEGRISTCLLPLFSALERVFRQSARADMRVIFQRILKESLSGRTDVSRGREGAAIGWLVDCLGWSEVRRERDRRSHTMLPPSALRDRTTNRRIKKNYEPPIRSKINF